MSGPVKIVALGPARPCGLRSCESEVPRIGPPALSPPPPSPPRARAMHRATGRLTVCGKGAALCWAAPELAQPGRPTSGLKLTSLGTSGGAQRSGVLRLTPNAQKGFGGKTVISLLWLPPLKQEENFLSELGDRVRSSVRPFYAAFPEAAGRYGDPRGLVQISHSSSKLAESCWFSGPGSIRSYAHSGRRLLASPAIRRYRCRQADSTGVGFL
jgi:hypothetical protein